MLTAIFIVSITLTCYILSLSKGPIWGLIAYANVYFNNHSEAINWWGAYLPDLRWSLLSFCILMLTIIIHRDKLSTHKLSFVYFLVFIFFLYVELLTNTIAVSLIEAKIFTHMMLTYCVIIFIIIKVLAKFEHLRLFVLSIIVFGAFLGLQGYLFGDFMDGRLNSIGPADAKGANELGVLLASIIPFILPFVVFGKKYEKIICCVSIPFIINGFTLTVSRGAFVSLIFGFIFVFFFIANKKLKKYLFIALIFIVPVILYFSDANYIKRISTLWDSDRSNTSAVNELSSGRTAIWKYGFKMVADYPFGTGPGGFKEIARFYMPEEILSFHPGKEYGVRAAHNSYLLVLVEMGYLGLCCFIVICFANMYILIKSSKKIQSIGKTDSFVYMLIIALCISTACTLFAGLFGENVYYEFFWWQIAISIVIRSFVINTGSINLNKQEAGELVPFC